MKYLRGEILITTIIMIIIYISSAFVLADPVIEDISINPTSPSPKSTITFTATVTGDQIDEVYLLLQECKEDLCFPRTNASMNKLESGKYQTSITLEESDATYIQYWLNINEDGTWYSSEEDIIKKNLSTKPEDSIPGFELLVFLVSIIILLFIIKRKRR